MNDLLLDDSHDLDISSGDLKIVTGAARVKQNLLIKLKLWRGEWFLDTEFGTPYLDGVLGKQLSLSGAVAALKQSILEVNDVNAITNFTYQFNRQTRQLDVQFECQTNQGLVTI